MRTDDQLHRRDGGNFYVVQHVPTDVAKITGQRQIWRSTKTGDRIEARRRAITIKAQLQGEFERARRVASNNLHARIYNDSQLEAIARELYEYTINNEEALRRQSIEAGEPLQEESYRLAYRDSMQADLSSGHYHHVHWWADYVIERDSLPIVGGSADYRYLLNCCQRTMIDAMNVLIARDNGDWSTQPRDPIIVDFRPVPKGHRLSELFDKYAAANPGKVKADKLNTDRYSMELLIQFIGDVGSATVTLIQVREWRDLLSAFPSRAKQMACFRGMLIADIVESNKEIGKPVIARRTVNKHLSALSVFMDWCIREGYRNDHNPCSGLFHAEEDSTVIRSFTIKELKAIFSHDWFDRERDHRFWLPVLALYSGARLGEIAQLAKADVREFHGRHCFHFTDTGGGGKSLKNKNSARVVPIHREIIKIGFLDFVASQNGDRVFPTALKNKRGQWASDISRDFGRLLKRLGMKQAGDEVTVDFHSFRHTFADGMREADYADDEFDILLGHRGSMTGRYGNEKAHVIKRKSEMMDALTYDLDLISILPN